MAQILLNDPNRAGGSSALDLHTEIGVIGVYNAARLALWAQDVNAMFAELYAAIGNGELPATPVPFSQTIPLSSGSRMPAQAVTGPLTFVAGGSPVAYASCRVRLTANGTNAPNFTAFGASPVAGGWVNTAGAVNHCQFWYDGTNYLYSVFQGSAVFPGGIPVIAPGVASVALPHGVNPTLTLTTNGSALNPARVPPASAFALSDTDGVTIDHVIGVTATSITLALAGTVGASDTLTLSYTPPGMSSYNTPATTAPAQDASGNLLAAITAAAVTVS
jgi:hypothetical protein